MTQQELGPNLSTRHKRKAMFLNQMNVVVPWTHLLSLIAPYAPRDKTGRRPLSWWQYYAFIPCSSALA